MSKADNCLENNSSENCENCSLTDVSHLTLAKMIDSSYDCQSENCASERIQKDIRPQENSNNTASHPSIDEIVNSFELLNVFDDSDSVSCDETFDPDITYKAAMVNPALRFLKIEDVFDKINEIVRHTAELTQLPSSTSRILLNLFEWDMVTLSTKYYERTDDEEFFQKYRVINPANILEISPENTDECQICLKTLETVDGEITGALCGHKFCNICWDQYLVTKITVEGLDNTTISCADKNCFVNLEDDFVLKMLTNPAIKLMCKRLVVDKFIQLKDNWCWCPSSKCNLAIEMLEIDESAVCQCGERFCHQCFDEWHAPVQCKHFKMWKAVDLDTLMYLADTTKECPNCASVIEKIGGHTGMARTGPMYSRYHLCIKDDSGGGPICGSNLAEIVSFGIECATANYPGVYSDVAYFNSWINTTLTWNKGTYSNVPTPTTRQLTSTSTIGKSSLYTLISGMTFLLFSR